MVPDETLPRPVFLMKYLTQGGERALHSHLTPPPSPTQKPRSRKPVEPFGSLPDGTQAHVHTLTSPSGMVVMVSNYGAILVKVRVPDREGVLADAALGYDSVDGYAGEANPYLGATVGRFANRIAGGKFCLDGKTWQLATNNAPGGIPCHLHGGITGYNRRLWRIIGEPTESKITFGLTSPDGEEGYPGTVEVRVTYEVGETNELRWKATATADAPTPINLVQHNYWNLSGNLERTIFDHEIQIFAEEYLAADMGLIPTGEKCRVDGTQFDFRSPVRIGDQVPGGPESLKFGEGYDLCYVLPESDSMILAARVCHADSGICMEVLTNQPGMHFYTGNFLNREDFQGNNPAAAGGLAYPTHSGFCLETEAFPDAPNHPDFPNSILRPGETYQHDLVFRFSNK